MATIQWRPEVNALTTPQSYWIRYVPRNSAGIEDLAADIAAKHPNFSEADILTILKAEDEAIQERLLNGEQVTKEGSCSWSPSFTGRLDSPDAPLPPLDESLHVNVRVSPPFVEALRQAARTERLPMNKKRPLIATARATVLNLNDVLNPEGLLRFTGENLRFNSGRADEGCVIAGTESGSAVQTRFGMVQESEIIVMPDIPAQSNPWNNEYTVSISTRYSEHGTLRTGTYGRMLRTPLTLSNFSHPNPPEVGMLTGNAAAPYVSAVGGNVTADETLRIQAVLDLRQDLLLFSLLDMEGQTGATVTVTANGEFTLPGFTGSALTSLDIRVNEYAALKEMIRNDYSGMLVDVLEVGV